MKTEKTASPVKPMSSLRRVLHKNVPWPWYIANMAASMFMGGITASLPGIQAKIMAGEIFDSALIWSFIGLSLVNMLLQASYSVSTTWAGYFTERSIQRRLWGKLIRMPMKRVDAQASSSLISRVTNDTTQASAFLQGILTAFYVGFLLVMIFLNIFNRSAVIGLWLLAVIPYMVLVAVIPGRLRFKASILRQKTLSSFTSFVAQRLNMVKKIKAAGMESREIELGIQAAEENYRAEMHYALVDCAAQPFAYLSEAVIKALILIMGGRMMAAGSMPLEVLLALFIQGSQLYSVSLMMISTFLQFRDVQGATKDIGDLMNGEDEALERKVSFTQPQADIILDHVSFGYTDRPVLNNVSLTIPNGKVTAIVGPSGAGKTTLLSLLERLYPPTEGQIRFGLVPVEDIHLNEWRSATGYVQQNSPLLSGSIRDNIAYGLDRKVTEDELKQAAKLAGAYDFIEKLPEKFNTDIGMLGSKLSGGQRQRIAIARMIIRDPDYLLLDEATSNLDAENEAQVQSSLNALVKGKTAVVVAHNLRTIIHADNIVVLDEGQIVAQGTHEQLYAGTPLYKKYIDLQFGHT